MQSSLICLLLLLTNKHVSITGWWLGGVLNYRSHGIRNGYVCKEQNNCTQHSRKLKHVATWIDANNGRINVIISRVLIADLRTIFIERSRIYRYCQVRTIGEECTSVEVFNPT
jgi:hypothetical protein